jgi:hypothetical protein
MNNDLERLAANLEFGSPARRDLALAFGLACAKRIEHLLEEPGVIACLAVLDAHVAGHASEAALVEAAHEAALMANRHRGSKSIDGCGHAAVSATYGVAKALEARAVEAAQYCAYAAVYASGGYAAVADREAFAPEFAWQVECLHNLAREARSLHAAPACS